MCDVNEINIKTPAGDLKATISGSIAEYPGIAIWLNDTPVVIVEHTNTDNKVQVVVFADTRDEEPTNMIEIQ